MIDFCERSLQIDYDRHGRTTMERSTLDIHGNPGFEALSMQVVQVLQIENLLEQGWEAKELVRSSASTALRQ